MKRDFSIIKSPVLVIGLFALLQGCGTSSDTKTVATETAFKQPPVVQDSLAILDSLIVTYPADLELLMMRGKYHVQRSHFALAAEDYSQATRLDSSCVVCWTGLGQAAEGAEKYRIASNAYRQALDLDVHAILALDRLVKLYLANKEHQAAMDAVNDLLVNDLHNGHGYFLKGLVYKYSGDTATALSSFQTAIEQDPSHVEALMQLGNLYTQQTNSVALAYYDRILTVHPDHKIALYNQAYAYHKLGEPSSAIRSYLTLLEKYPKNVSATFNIGAIYYDEFRMEDSARYYFKSALLINDQYIPAKEALRILDET